MECHNETGYNLARHPNAGSSAFIILTESKTDIEASAKRHSLSALRQAAADHSVHASLFAFLLTRLIILAVILLTSSIGFQPPATTPFGVVHESNGSLHNRNVKEILSSLTSGADSAWLMNIAINGYEKERFNTATQHTWAYFPLYPVLWRWAARITGEFPLTGMALSTCFLLLGLIFLHRTVMLFGYEREVADRAVFYVAAFPLSYFFSLAQTESLFFLLSVACIYAAKRDRWWIAGLVAALASATRFAGVFLLVPLAVLYWQASRAAMVRSAPESRQLAPSRVSAKVTSLLLAPLGLIAFMIYLKQITGNAFAFADIQVTWGHSYGFFWRPLFTYLKDPLLLSAGWDFRLLNFAAAIVALVCSLVLLKRREWALGLFALISIVVPMSSQPLLQSLARYTSVIFPVFIVLALWGRRPRVDQTIRAIFIGLLCLMSALLAARVTLALA